METMPFTLQAGETLLHTEETRVVPANRSPLPCMVWLTTQRIVVQWKESGLLGRGQLREIALLLRDVKETRTPGGPLVQIAAKDGTLLSLQSLHPIVFRQQVMEAIAASNADASVSALPQEMENTNEKAMPDSTGNAPLALDTAICPRCSGKGVPEARFCPYCALYLRPDAAYCRRCDHDYPAHFRYCPHCGDSLLSTDDNARPTKPRSGKS